VSLKRTGKAFKVDRITIFDVECKEIITDSVNAWFEERTVEEIKARAMMMTLDSEAIEGADSDLKKVTELMDTGYDREPESEPVKEEEPKQEKDSSWSGFISRLDDVQKAYLAAALDGKGAAYLKENGLVMSIADDAINSVAVDCIGDSVMEDGRVFEEYSSDIRDAM